MFGEIIRILAQQFDGQRFDPHLTLTTAQDRRSPKKVLRDISTAPIRLRVRGVSFSSEFTKTIFARFGASKSLQHLVVDLGGKPVRDPHVSLLYKKMSILTKRELASSIRLPFREVVFNSIKAVRSSSPTRTPDDVEAWRVIATKSLRQ